MVRRRRKIPTRGLLPEPPCQPADGRTFESRPDRATLPKSVSEQRIAANINGLKGFCLSLEQMRDIDRLDQRLPLAWGKPGKPMDPHDTE